MVVNFLLSLITESGPAYLFDEESFNKVFKGEPMFDPNRPHKAVINISFSICPVEATGDVSGQNVSRQQLQSDGLKHRLMEVKGSSYEDCVEELKTLLEKITKIGQ